MRAAGFGVFDGLISLLLAGIAIFAILSVYQSGNQSGKATDTYNMLIAVKQAITLLNNGDFQNLATAQTTLVANSGLVPQLNIVSGQLINSFGTQMTVTGNSPSPGYTVALGQLPVKACAVILSTVSGDGDATEVHTVGGSGTWDRSTDPIVLTPNDVADACAVGGTYGTVAVTINYGNPWVAP